MGTRQVEHSGRHVVWLATFIHLICQTVTTVLIFFFFFFFLKQIFFVHVNGKLFTHYLVQLALPVLLSFQVTSIIIIHINYIYKE